MPGFTTSNWMTETGRRPDLEALDVNPPIGYIGSRVYPRTPSRFAAGTLSGMTLPTYAAAQTSRVDGVAPTTTLITNSEVSYTATETISRYGKTAKQVMDTMDIYRCDEQGGAAAIRSMMYTLEKKRLTKLVTPIASTYDNLITGQATDDILVLVDTALEAIRLYHGVRVLVMNIKMLHKFGRSASLANFYGSAPVERTESMIQLKNRVVTALQQVFLLDEILIADSSILNDAGNAPVVNDNTIVAAVIPHENEVTEFSYTLTPELGRTVVYQPYEGLRPFQVESFPDMATRTNCYDAVTRSDIVEFNPMEKRIIDCTNVSFAGGQSIQITGGTVVTIDGGTVSA